MYQLLAALQLGRIGLTYEDTGIPHNRFAAVNALYCTIQPCSWRGR